MKSTTFSRVIAFLEENKGEQPTIDDLVGKIEEFLEGEEDQAYNSVYIIKEPRRTFWRENINHNYSTKAKCCHFSSESGVNCE